MAQPSVRSSWGYTEISNEPRSNCRLGVQIASFVLACTSLGPKGDDPGDDPGGSASILGPDRVTLDDTDARLQIAITGGTALAWLYGVISPDSGDYDEGCRDASDVCHALGPTGGTLAWCTGDRPSDGATCVARLYFREGIVSHVVRPSTGIGCWAWGDDADWWDGCTVTDWAADSY